jgi:hypothetical protein
MKAHEDEIDRITKLVAERYVVLGFQFEEGSLRTLVAAAINSYVPQFEWEEIAVLPNFRTAPIEYGGKRVSLNVRCGARRMKWSGSVPDGVADTSYEERVKCNLIERSGRSIIRWIMTGKAGDDA